MGQQELTTDGYIFLDISRPYVAWATYRSVLISPPNIQDSNGRFISWWQADLHRNSPHIKREIALEEIRVQQFPGRVSRLNGIFCFQDRESATDAADHWGGQFKLEILAEVNLLEAQGRDRLDSNWITYADSNTVRPSDAWISSYWRGEPYPGKKPIWETLVEGKVTVLGTDLRKQAYEIVRANWPDSLMFLEISRLGAWIGSDIGSMSVFMAEDAENYNFTFCMDMRDADNKNFLIQLSQLIKSGHPVNYADVKPHYDKGSFGKVPDMSAFQFSCPKDMRKYETLNA